MINYDYVVVGAGIGGVNVCAGIREHDPKGSILMVSADPDLPYHRPWLSKRFLAEKDFDPLKLQIHPETWYEDHKIDLRVATMVTAFNIERRVIVLGTGQGVEFRKACLATGSRAHRPDAAGANLGNLFYLRSLREAMALRESLGPKTSVVVVGGGLIALEAAAALASRKTKVRLVMQEAAPWSRWVDAATSEWLASLFAAHGVELLMRESLNGFEGKTVIRNVQTKSGMRVAADIVIAALGADPNLQLVPGTPLGLHGVTHVSELLETDEKGIYAVGDIAAYPDKHYGGVRRWTHADCAAAQGLVAGANMTGKKRIRFSYFPKFVSELFQHRIVVIGDPDRPVTRIEREGDLESGVFSLIRKQGDTIQAAILFNPSEQSEAEWLEKLVAAHPAK